MHDPRYPIGPLQLPGTLAPAERAAALGRMAALPERLAAAVRGLSAADLDRRYRDGGWTLRQVVHHLADSHVNAYVRCKLTLTEDQPPIRAYDEKRWADQPDVAGPIGASLLLVQSVHDRWLACLRAVPAQAFARTCVHSERGRLTLDDLVATYAWHGDHHVAHINSVLRRA
jgi:uncharacterized damage-inducible protein DinB